MIGTTDALLALAMLAAFALVLGGFWLLRAPGGNRLKAGLMVAAGLVTIFNVWIATLPGPESAGPPPRRQSPPETIAP